MQVALVPEGDMVRDPHLPRSFGCRGTGRVRLTGGTWVNNSDLWPYFCGPQLPAVVDLAGTAAHGALGSARGFINMHWKQIPVPHPVIPGGSQNTSGVGPAGHMQGCDHVHGHIPDGPELKGQTQHTLTGTAWSPPYLMSLSVILVTHSQPES